MISTILLIPPDGDPMGLLAEHLGCRPSSMYQPFRENPLGGGTFGPEWVLRVWDERGEAPPHAGLLLAYDGKPVPEGCDRLTRVAWARLEYGAAGSTSFVLRGDIDTCEYRRRLAGDWCIRFLDSEGREIEALAAGGDQ